LNRSDALGREKPTVTPPFRGEPGPVHRGTQLDVKPETSWERFNGTLYPDCIPFFIPGSSFVDDWFVEDDLTAFGAHLEVAIRVHL
jgi:hypothetical protein